MYIANIFIVFHNFFPENINIKTSLKNIKVDKNNDARKTFTGHHDLRERGKKE